ncbi:hypothetical protein [Shimia sp. SDUM112013]|uniref:hypothetical protein n=1 Tax=Shimia sp. SDUM112013 TaxID=3136160 RepID=UPI0032EEFC48
MSDRRSPVFLERQSYRRRRLIDSIRMLPLIGALLWFIPVLWPTGPVSVISTSQAIIYLFGCWLALIVLGLTFARAIKRFGLEEFDADDATDEGR